MNLVQIKQGTLKGVVCDNGVKYIAFKGIPYAKPPVGKLRFKVSTSIRTIVDILTRTVDSRILKKIIISIKFNIIFLT